MLLFLLIFFLLLAAICLYFGWQPASTDHGSAYRARGGFVLSLGFVAAIVFFLYLQAGAKERLEAAGIAPHPGLISPMGTAVGQGGENRIWVFETAVADGEMLDFYRDPGHLSGWQLADDRRSGLVFYRGQQRLTISGGASGHALIFMITPRDEE